MRGLKFAFKNLIYIIDFVAPLAGAWIEIIMDGNLGGIIQVAPLAGAWIEI